MYHFCYVVDPLLKCGLLTGALTSCCGVQGFDSWASWDTNVLYAILHESIYCQLSASNWAAQKVLNSEFSEHFDAALSARNGTSVMFTGARAQQSFHHMRSLFGTAAAPFVWCKTRCSREIAVSFAPCIMMDLLPAL